MAHHTRVKALQLPGTHGSKIAGCRHSGELCIGFANFQLAPAPSKFGRLSFDNSSCLSTHSHTTLEARASRMAGQTEGLSALGTTRGAQNHTRLTVCKLQGARVGKRLPARKPAGGGTPLHAVGEASSDLAEKLIRELESKAPRVFVAESSRAGAGKGVFANEHVPAGELLTEYVGQRLIGQESRLEHEICLKEAGLEDTYTIFVSRDCSIYGDRDVGPERGVACLINDHDCITADDLGDLTAAVDRYIDGIVAHQNVDWFVLGDRLFAQACVDVGPGQELFTSYTTAWWLDRLRRELLIRACDHVSLKWKEYAPRAVDFSATDVDLIKREWALIRKVERVSREAVRWERDAFVMKKLMSFEDRLYEIDPSPDYWEEDVEYGLAGCDWCIEHQLKKHMRAGS